MLQAQALWKSYGHGKRRVEVLKGLSLRLEDPGITCILGPSGAGKSTLLNVLSGLDAPDQGTVLFAQRDLYRMRASDRERWLNQSVGFVFQFYHLLSDLTAIENVILPALVHNQKSRRGALERAQSLLGKLGLAHRSSHFPSELSGGELQRAALARALMNDPPLLFCDEPTGNLDSANGRMICELLQNLAREEHKTVLIVSHDDTIARISDRILRMEDGAWVSVTPNHERGHGV